MAQLLNMFDYVIFEKSACFLLSINKNECICFVLFYLFLPVTKKRQLCYLLWTNPHSFKNYRFPNFPVASLNSS